MARRESHRARLPRLPDLSTTTPAVRAHLAAADREARNRPSAPDAVAGLCLAYHADAFHDQAIRCYSALLALQPAAWRWHYDRALAHIANGSDAAARADLLTVVQLAPTHGPALWRLGHAEFTRGNMDGAAEYWRRAQSAPPAAQTSANGAPPLVAAASVSDHAALGLARIALLRSDHDTARTLLEPVVARAPRFGAAWRLLGDVHTAAGRTAAAHAAAARAQRLPPSSSFADPAVERLVNDSRSTLLLLQQALEADLEINAAWHEHVIRRSFAFNPDNPEVVYEMSRLLRRLGDDEEALALLRRYHEMVDDPLALAEIASYLSELGRLQEAESLLQQAARGPANANVHADLGAIRAQRGDMARAAAEFERALALNPFHVSARLNLAALLLLDGRHQDAERHLRQVLAVEPANAKAHANMGIVFERRGRPAEALAHFTEALRLDPELTLAAERSAAIQGTKR
jgi:tetratricopeptide (TPR) repeat protein